MILFVSPIRESSHNVEWAINGRTETEFAEISGFSITLRFGSGERYLGRLSGLR